jgi:nickel-dependent lactate racemase
MRIEMACGRRTIELEAAEERRVAGVRAPLAPPLADLSDAVARALEEPREYPPLRRALTPEDHVAIVVDPSLPHLAELLVPIFEHLRKAGVGAEAVTLVCPATSFSQAWIDGLPDECQEARVEVHQPGDRKKLAYLATTKGGRRVYLNRSAVDADQLIVLSGRRYDVLEGYAGAESALYPALSDEATLAEWRTKLHLSPPGEEPWSIQAEAQEIAWLIGAPFFVQVIQGSGEEICHVLGGPLPSSAEGRALLDARWQVSAADAADLVVTALSGDPDTHTFADLARAFLAAARVVKPGGKVVVLSDALPQLGPAAEILRHHDEPRPALKQLADDKPEDYEAGWMWAQAAQHAKLYLLSRLPLDVVEELFATPLDQAAQAQKLLSSAPSYFILPDGHRSLAVLE